MKKLTPEVSEFYHLVTIRPGKYSFPKFGSIDLTTLHLDEAHELVKNGFKFLVPKKPNPVTEPVEVTNNNKNPENPNNHSEKPINDDLEVFRGNKKFINKLLTLNYSDLTFKERSVFFNDEKYFNEKKYILHDISQIYNEIKSNHAAIKQSKSDHKRKELNKQLWSLDDHRAHLFKMIDTWEHNEPIKESPEEVAVRKALERANEIKTLTNYIGRFEDQFIKLPNSAKKTKKLNEIKKRKTRLLELGAPYQRKKRK